MPFDVAQLTKRLGLDPEKIKGLAAKLFSSKGETKRDDASASEVAAEISGPISSIAKALLGATGSIGESYFPPNVIGGSCPRIAGEEEEVVWNAAAETCDSERVHVVWQATGTKVWYLAVHSTELASHADSWCPLASLLPGMKDAQPAPVCYTYYGDEMATMMMVTEDVLQLYRGTNMIVRAKAERTARELGNATIVELVPDRIAALTPAPWYSMSLFEDRARRILGAMAVATALGMAALAFIVWLLASMSLLATSHDLSAAQSRTELKTQELLNSAVRLRASPLREQLATFADLNDGLLDLNGFLEVYEIKNGKARWRAVVPSNVTADRIAALNGKTIDTKPEGTVIGNAEEIAYEAQGGGNK